MVLEFTLNRPGGSAGEDDSYEFDDSEESAFRVLPAEPKPRDEMIGYLMIAVGGAIGAIARYEVTNLIQHQGHAGFPYGTFVVNMTGCLVIGFTIGLLDEHVVANPNWRLLIVTGFVGAYTTFSTFEAETFNAVTSGDFAIALGNVAGSVVAGYFAVWLGFALARLVPA